MRTSCLALRLVSLAALLAVVAGACSPTPSVSPEATPPPTGLAHFAGSGIAFDYPAAWRSVHFDNFSSFTSSIVSLGTTEFHDPCTRGPDSLSCGVAYTLEPGQMAVEVGNAAFPTFSILDVPAGATPVTAGGLPGWVEDADPFAATRSTAARSWTLAMPGSIDNYFTVRAEVRDLDPATAFAPVDALVASWAYDQPVVPLPTGADAAPAAAAALKSALAEMVRSGEPAYACFPQTGSRRFQVTALPGMGPLAKPQVATCSTSIEATPLGMWRAHLVAHLSERDPQAGWGVDITMYITADGQPGNTTSAPLDQ